MSFATVNFVFFLILCNKDFGTPVSTSTYLTDFDGERIIEAQTIFSLSSSEF